MGCGLTAAAVLIVIFLILRFTSVKIPIGPFFLVTSILMAALVVIFAGGGIHALIEGDLIEGTYLSIVQLTIGSACIRTSKLLRHR